ncbi:MAG TPA: glycosyltransferase [Mycobacteriales bacterium]|nr:glycosyltransferase [Mycobacteriales bacterium]
MPRVSVVVPIYNVEPFLEECLQSVETQTFTDFEVVMVDDGSTDGSARIAREFEQRDGRFRLVQQANGGLGCARNTGIDRSVGDTMLFLDSDDVLPPDALQLLLTALDTSGSDFATGNVWRIRPAGLMPSTWLAPVFAESRLATHVTKFRPLIADRLACNKLWRRSFWDEHGLRFPEGVLHEDIYVTVPAHFLARSVDVVSEPVYYWRARVGDVRSITQRRTEITTIQHRLAAIDHVRQFLRAQQLPEALRWYDASVVADDLRPFITLLLRADEDYRRQFLDLVNDFLDDTDPSIFDELPPDERQRWELVRARDLDGLFALLRRQRREGRQTPVDVQPPTLVERVARRVPQSVRRLVPRSVRRRLLRPGGR